MDYFHEESVNKAGATARGALYFACYEGMIIIGIFKKFNPKGIKL